VTASGSTAWGTNSYRISGGDKNIAASSPVDATTANADPPSFSPSFGNGKLWIAAGHWGNSTAVVNVTGGPSGYSGFLVSQTSSRAMASAWLDANAATENPGAFTSAAATHRVYTVAIS
jgi:hypothetical protein